MADRETRRLQKMWARYKRKSSHIIRKALIEYYLPLLRIHARRLRASLAGRVSVDELTSAGVLGLISAIEAFDPSRGIKFETFSAKRIRGAMYDELRRQDWVPRLVRDRARRLANVVERFHLEYGRAPSSEEVEQSLSLAGEAFERLRRDARPVSVFTMSHARRNRSRRHDEPEGNNFADDGAADPARETQRRMLREYIARGLSETERLIFLLYYYEQMSLEEIGKTLGISESRVCQLHQRLLKHVRSRLTEDFLREQMVA